MWQTLLLLPAMLMVATRSSAAVPAKPNIILVMADDMGWGQTSYNQHPILKTPHLDAMAANGLRLDRFYAGAPNCSPTRATVMTGRTNDRCGVQDHGFPLRLQERTIAQAMQKAGYSTAHFGKWHLSGFGGPGAPVLRDDERNPGKFGFDHWLSVTNFFDRNPILSRNGKIEEFQGDSSEIIVGEALKFIGTQSKTDKPFFTVIWYGSPHNPFMASESDMAPFEKLDKASRSHYAELVALDRSIGTLRQGLRDLKIDSNTLVWFNSDNGGLPGIKPDSVGGLRGNKNTLYEGGLRVPGIIEWPAVIPKPRVTKFPAGTVDIFPTLAGLIGLPDMVMLKPSDGMNLAPLFAKELAIRETPLGFRHTNRAAWIDNQWKLVKPDRAKATFELYDLSTDPNETTDLAAKQPDTFARLKTAFEKWNASVDASVAGKDYAEGRVTDSVSQRRNWYDHEMYRHWIEAWKQRPEYKPYLDKKK